MIQESYEALKQDVAKQGMQLVENTTDDEGGFKLKRYLDCAVIKRLHNRLEDEGVKQFDTVYGYFQEGIDAYPGAGIKEKRIYKFALEILIV